MIQACSLCLTRGSERSRRNLCAGYSGPFCEWKSSVSWVRTCDKVAASTTDLCSQTRLEEKLIDGKLFKSLRIKRASFTHSFNQVSTVHFPLSTAHLWQFEGSKILVGTPRRAAVVASGDHSGQGKEVTSMWSHGACGIAAPNAEPRCPT